MFVCRHGVSGELLSDRGANLLSRLFIDVCKLLGVCKIIPWYTTYRGIGWLRTSIILCRRCWPNMPRSLVQVGLYISSNCCLLIGLDCILLQESHHSISFMGGTQGSQLRPLSQDLVVCIRKDIEDYRLELTHVLATAWKLAWQNIGKARWQKECYDSLAKR